MSKVIEPVFLDKTGRRIAAVLEQMTYGDNMARIESLTETDLARCSIVEAVGIPEYVDDVSAYSKYGITETGWYIFARIYARTGYMVTSATIVTGADGWIVTVGADYVDVAIGFQVAAASRKVTIDWGAYAESFVFKATDLAVRNLDYRTTFYVYDISPFTTWEYGLTTDTAFVADKKYFTLGDGEYTQAEVTAADPVPAYYTLTDKVYTQATGTFTEGVTYYTKDGDTYTEAEVTVGDQIPADPAYYTLTNVVYTQATGTFAEGVTYYTKNGETYTEAEVTVGDPIPAYYSHSKVKFEGMARNVTYQLDEIIDCPQEYILPEIEDDGHGAWYEIRLRHAGSYSSTLVVPEGVKIATEHTQAETAGMNMVDLHYMSIDGIKLWRFMNTHSSIPSTT